MLSSSSSEEDAELPSSWSSPRALAQRSPRLAEGRVGIPCRYGLPPPAPLVVPPAEDAPWSSAPLLLRLLRLLSRNLPLDERLPFPPALKPL